MTLGRDGHKKRHVSPEQAGVAMESQHKLRSRNGVLDVFQLSTNAADRVQVKPRGPNAGLWQSLRPVGRKTKKATPAKRQRG